MAKLSSMRLLPIRCLQWAADRKRVSSAAHPKLLLLSYIQGVPNLLEMPFEFNGLKNIFLSGADKLSSRPVSKSNMF